MTIETLYREIPEPLETVDRDSVAGLIVPWNQAADILEVRDGELVEYREAFDPGAFDKQALSGNPGTIRKIEFVDGHAGGLGKTGYALDLETRDNGQWALFRVLPRFADDVRTMIRDGVDGLSVGFHPKRGGTVVRDGVQVRTDAHLVHVALTPTPKYVEARTMAMRAAQERTDELERAEHRRMVDDILATRDRWAHLD